MRPSPAEAMRIDAHQHFWQVARGDYGWLTPASGTLWRDFMPEDLAPLLQGAGFDRTILVQAAPTRAETDFLLEIAARTPFVAGVVGWTDFAAPDAAATIAAMAGDPLLAGLRPMVQDIADDDWLARPALAPAFEAMIAASLVFDALVLPRHLPRLLTVMDRHPALTVVVDHAAKPAIRQWTSRQGASGQWTSGQGTSEPDAYAAWRQDLAAVAARPQAFCKLSGLVTEAGADWRIADLAPIVKHLLATFGPERLLFGSDWPVLTLAAGYPAWSEAAAALCAGLSAPAREAVFGGTAARVYLARRGRRT